jgi:hypothetical protein
LLAVAAAAATDSSYGRIDGDMTLVFGAGMTASPRGVSGALDLRARYLDTAGVFVSYDEGFGGPVEPTRTLAMGIELRPIFLSRWLTDSEIGIPHLDLILDSFALELGAAILQPKMGDFGDRIALQAGIGIEIPILPHANGPWIGLHGGARISDKGLSREIQTPLEQSGFLTITLAWHQVVKSGVVDVGDHIR